MATLKQRLETLERPNGQSATHEEFVLWCVEHGPADSGPTVTDEEVDAFLHPNKAEPKHAKP